jgi:predicted phage tail protein
MNATAIQAANNTQPCFRKTIDKTTYIVRVHFSQTAKETMEDKIKRLLREEVRKM